MCIVSSWDKSTFQFVLELSCTAADQLVWLRGTEVERRCLTNELSLSCDSSTYSWRVTTYIGKPSAVGKLTRPTQLFILSGSID